MKIYQFCGRGFISLSQKYEERVRKFPFLARHYFKSESELYRFIYIGQCIVSQEEGFQHKTLNWSTFFHLLVPTYKQGRKEGPETIRTVHKFRSNRLKWKIKTRVTSSNLRVTSSNLRVTSSNPRVTRSNPRVTSSNPRVSSSNSRVKTSNQRVTISNARVTSSNPRVRRLKA